MGKLLELSKDLHGLLLTQEEFKLPLSAVISEYQLWFGKKTPFDPVVYGFTSIVNLLEALPAVVEVSTCTCSLMWNLSIPMCRFDVIFSFVIWLASSF